MQIKTNKLIVKMPKKSILIRRELSMKKWINLFVAILILTLLIGCGNTQEAKADEKPQEVVEDNDSNSSNDINEEEEKEDEEPKEQPKEIDLNAIKPNEAGEIMVLMYHHIREPEAEWARTPENFRRDLQTLYEKGFRPISLNDYVVGNITTEAGFTPVVITFDDGNQNNFNMIQNSGGEWIIDPDSAVGILVDFNKKHPDFPLKATFYINGGTPFGQKEWVEHKLNYIVDMGMELGNHTNTHIDFTQASAEKMQEELGKLKRLIDNYVKEYEVNTLALPFGSKPKEQELRKYLIEGTFEGTNYHNVAILEVGWDPYLSPFHKNFDFSRIRRVRASETKVDGVGMYDWLKAFESGKRVRYISDGDPDKISVPDKYQEQIKAPEGKTIRSY